MKDLIERRAAIERATQCHDFYKGATIPTDKARRDELLNVMCWLGELPSAQLKPYREGYQTGFNEGYQAGFKDAQPERKRGKWIYSEDEYGVDGYHCDKCGFFVPWDYVHKFINYIEDYNYCPNCGADMREVQDERPD